MISGYSEKFRLDIIQSAVRGYERQCLEADAGGRPLYRSRSYQQADRQRKKLLMPSSRLRDFRAGHTRRGVGKTSANGGHGGDKPNWDEDEGG